MSQHHQEETEWLMIFDAHKFHVYIVVLLESGATRIDWQDDSRLTFEPYVPQPAQETHAMGIASFCAACLEEEIKPYLSEYKLFKFNCRTVSVLILLRMGFDSEAIYKPLAQASMMCGLNESECMSADEIRHFIDWYKSQHGGCTLF
jgi:hypothetical protein